MTKITRIKPSNKAFRFLNLNEMKNFLRIDHDEDDMMLQNLCDAAIERLENYTRQSIVNKDYHVSYIDIYSDTLILPITPVIQIKSANVIANGIFKTLSDKMYHINGNSITFSYIPSSSMTIEYTAGIAENESEVSGSIRNAILEIVAQMYDNRGTSNYLSDSDMERWLGLCRYNLFLA